MAAVPSAPPLNPPMKFRDKRIDNGSSGALYFDVRVFCTYERLIVVISILLTNLFIVCASMLVVISLFDQNCFDFSRLLIVSTELLFRAM